MNLIKKYVFKIISITLLSSTLLINSMEPKKPGRSARMTQRALNQIARVLTGVAQVTSLLNPSNTTTTTTTTTTQEFEFTALPEELQGHILGLLTVNSQATTLQEAAATINALYLVNHQLNQLIDENCLAIINHLAARFRLPLIAVARRLRTRGAESLINGFFENIYGGE